ncbi:hypothetical protein [Mycobacterium sp. 1274761.0]|uniref:hypothetical protein n=1 Tax=Mycobacterium sp. 1274761.0 TaxID=1834077 RepID=UPI0007FCA0C4|nr:hypothetical protein [Mycobacterium sp. 1274761.0]OBK78703.1 hypothetical protein A5651_01895 [Mycobacterium sp. 1274761.0]
MRTIALTSAALLAVTGCTAERVVNTGEWATATATSTSVAPSLPPTNPALLPDAHDFAQDLNGQAAYYFSTPSGRWQCAILPRDKAGCVAAAGALAITGAPDMVADATGQEVPPNAVVIEPQGDPHFAALDAAQFEPPAPAPMLPFNRTLIVARFRCNIQQATGVSCLSEESGNGFTFSADGYLPHYSEVPLDAP